MNIAFMEETRNKYRVLVGKAEGKISPARPRCRSQYSVKIIIIIIIISSPPPPPPPSSCSYHGVGPVVDPLFKYKVKWCVIVQPLLPSSHSHLLVIKPVHIIEATKTKSRQYNCFTRNGGNAIPNHAWLEAKGSTPTTGFTLFWAHRRFRDNFNPWQVLQEEGAQIHVFIWCSRAISNMLLWAR